MKKLLLVVFIIFTSFLLTSSPTNAQSQNELFEGTITKILSEKEVQISNINQRYQKLEVILTSGSNKGQIIQIDQGDFLSANPISYNVGDKIVLQSSQGLDNTVIYNIADYQRRSELFYLFVIFIVLTVVVGGIWGITSLIGMAFSFFIIFSFVLPQIINGNDPVLIAILAAIVIIPVTFYLSHGVNVKTNVSIIGTLITLITVGLLSTFFVNITKLSGFSSEESRFLTFETQNHINMKGLLLAGMIISSLGILDDITISQASIIKELKDSNKKISAKELFSRGMRVGRDHISSLVNTLVLVYAGASLPLLLLFINNPQPFEQVINLEIIAEEIVKTLVGSIGLILAVPITTVIAVYYFSKQKD